MPLPRRSSPLATRCSRPAVGSSGQVVPMAEQLSVRARLLNLEQVREVCGHVGRDLALETMHAAGVTRLGRRIFVRPSDLDAYLERKKEEGPPT